MQIYKLILSENKLKTGKKLQCLQFVLDFSHHIYKMFSQNYKIHPDLEKAILKYIVYVFSRRSNELNTKKL